MLSSKIERKLFLITSTPLTFVIITISLFLLFDSLENVEKDIKQKGQYITEQATLLAEFHLYTGNTEKIEEVADLIIKSNEIGFIKFYEETNNTAVIREKKRNKKHEKVFSQVIYNSNTDINDFQADSKASDSNEKLGYVEIGLSDNETLLKKQLIYKRIIFIAIAAIIVGLLLTYCFSLRLMNSLNSLMVSTTEIEKKNFSQRCKENGSGELLKIQRAFNNMAESIQLNEQDLQHKITIATESLNQTIEELSHKNIELDRTRKQTIELEKSKAISDERARIMKDMHDGIGGQLVASLALIEKEKDTHIRQNISEVLSNCLDDFRLIINSLNTNANILSALLADFKYRIGKRIESLDIQLHWQLDVAADDVQLQPQQGLHILRILQESFSNIIKHANASTIEFSVLERDDNIILQVQDDGQFTNGSDCCHGQGVKNMHWRAQQLGAILLIQPGDNGGCCVQLSIPKATVDNNTTR